MLIDILYSIDLAICGNGYGGINPTIRCKTAGHTGYRATSSNALTTDAIHVGITTTNCNTILARFCRIAQEKNGFLVQAPRYGSAHPLWAAYCLQYHAGRIAKAKCAGHTAP